MNQQSTTNMMYLLYSTVPVFILLIKILRILHLRFRDIDLDLHVYNLTVFTFDLLSFSFLMLYIGIVQMKLIDKSLLN